MLVWIRSRIPAYIRHLATYDVLLIERTDKETYFRDVKAVIDRVSYTYTALILLHLHNIVCISIGVYTCTLKYTYINVCIQKIKQTGSLCWLGQDRPSGSSLRRIDNHRELETALAAVCAGPAGPGGKARATFANVSLERCSLFYQLHLFSNCKGLSLYCFWCLYSLYVYVCMCV